MENTEEKKQNVRMEITALPFVNYALQQSGKSFVISVEVSAIEEAENVELTLSPSPEIFKELKVKIDCIPKSTALRLNNLKPDLNGEYLGSLTEKEAGTVTFTLSSEQGEVLLQKEMPVSVFAFDQWHGIGYYPELLVSFITPNHPKIAEILAASTEYLSKWTGDPSMDAYQSKDPNRVLKQAAAIFAALKDMNIVYAVSPASFGESGQRVRLCDAVTDQKLGNCLDITLLYAACLEAAGLHPIIIITPGHAFTAFWLDDLTFPEIIGDDASVITKRLAGGVSEIAAVETTLICAGQNAGFDDARAKAESELSGIGAADCIIDVCRARLSGITPLPQRIMTDHGFVINHDFKTEKPAAAPAQIADTIAVAEGRAEEKDLPKMVQWERKLLDLGLRNSLINLRPTRNIIPLLTPSLEELEDALSDGEEFSIMRKPEDWYSEGDKPDFENIRPSGSSAELIRAEFKEKRLRSILTEAELQKNIVSLYRASKLSLEENGANTLYLALGLIRWYETARSPQPRYAPIVLLPVDIIRKSALKGCVIKLRDDDPQMNITMLEKIKQDFGIEITGLDPLPADQHGIDMRLVFTVIRKAIMALPRWDVLETACIGIFSFSQFVMWNDIRNRSDDLIKNKVVKSLIDGRLSWVPEPMEMGDKVDENNVLLPMAADASQLFAVKSASEGKSFVLHGPPGTGKSQTITSLIAAALAEGKSVLFAAEKMAALEVVQKRLDKIGIGAFCLELHSNKSKKRDILEQLRQASEVTKTTSPEEYREKSEQTASVRAELNAYAKELHSPQNSGYTPYELINGYEEYKSAPEIPPFTRDYVKSLTHSRVEEFDALVQRLAAAGKAAGHPHNHPLSRVGLSDYSQQLKSDLPDKITAYQNSLFDLEKPLNDFTEAQGISAATFDGVKKQGEIASEMLLWNDFPTAWAKAENPALYFTEIKEMCGHCEAADQKRQVLLQTFNETFLQQDGQQLLTEYNAVNAKWAIPKSVGLNSMAKRISGYAKSPVRKENLQQHINDLCGYQSEQKAADALFAKYGGDMGNLYIGKTTDWQAAASTAEQARQSAEKLRQLTGGENFRLNNCGSRELKTAAEGLVYGLESAENAKKDLYRLLNIKEASGESWIAEEKRLCQSIKDNQDNLREWSAFNGVAKEVKQWGLSNITAAYAEGVSHSDLFPAYKKSLLFAMINTAIDENEVLSGFSGAVFEEKINRLKRLDEDLMKLSQQEIFCRLAANIPNFSMEAAKSSEIGILQKAIKSGGRGVSIRQLFQQIPTLLPKLCPCMLMSPISAAQYLDPERAPFDLVVFDEASQLPTCKAVGVLARGREAVIVGDPKQMPPTSFFATSAVCEDSLEVEDLESILDDCLALNMPETHLLWHYRSRHESLIAFSNSRFYENKLFTFPSVNDRERKVSLVHVDGVFDRGKTRQNRAEAEAVVEELKRRCHDENLSKLSVGVVTFNISQQNLIDDLLNEACKNDSELEKWAYNSPEPVFIKNLENVQGDERDVILFSVGYGPDSEGNVYMNFGPLNRDGGWRRLNVAVSRARCEMKVFSTLTPDRINLSKTGAEGVAALKEFLEYAGGKELALTGTSAIARRKKDAVSVSICEELNKSGYQTDMQVGHSAYRIDVGVIDPDNPEKYLLGILLDGACYNDAKTAKDREIAQIGVLKGLGWNICRVWTMDWWDNRDKEIKKLLKKLDNLKNGIAEEEIQVEKTAENIYKPKEETPEKIEEKASRIRTAPASSLKLKTYAPAVLSTAAEPKAEFDAEQACKNISEIIAAEAPITEELLTKRLLPSLGYTRTGTKIAEGISGAIKQLKIRSTEENGQKLYWSSAQNPYAYYAFRTAGDGEGRREPKDIPLSEAANAVIYALHLELGLSGEDLIKESAKLMGYQRVQGTLSDLFTAAITQTERQGRISRGTNGNYTLTDEGKQIVRRIENSIK